MTAVLTVSVIVFGVLSYLRLPVNDLPVVDYPGDFGAGELSRSEPGHGRQQHRHAARTAVHADQRAGTGDLAEHAGPRELHAAVRAGQEHRRGRDGRADRHFAGHRQPAHRSAVAADLLENQSERPADSVHRSDQRLGHARPALRLRQHAGGPADQHSARREQRERVWHEVRRAHQGRSLENVGARNFDRRPHQRREERDELHRRGAVRQLVRHGSAAAEGATGKRRGVRESDRQQHQRRARLFARCRRTSKTPCRTSASG